MLEPVIGLEVHLALRTRTKLFCGCPTDGTGGGPNARTCPVCLGLPGSLPVVNAEALELALRLALALGCDVPARSRFHRKHYFYPDAPKNYQISQYDEPIGQHGAIAVPGGRTIGITRVHLEEDAGRLVHPTYADHSLVDLDRAGTPLLEMVTEPDLRTPDEARAFLTEVRAIARALGVSDASPEEGKLRADVNVSLRAPGGPFGTKVEVKNLNSFRSVAAALAFEIRRQTVLLEEGRPVVQETRGWNEGGQKTYGMRGKEGEADYRYMADPDLPEIDVDPAWKAQVVARMPELPAAKEARFVALGVRPADAHLIAYDVATTAAFERAVAAYAGAPQNVANWLVTDVAGVLHERGATLDACAMRPEGLAALLALVDEGVISGKIAKDLLPEVIDGADPRERVARFGLRQVSDEDELGSVVDRVLEANPDLVARVAHNPKAVNALLGAVMRATDGTAKPDLVRRLLEERVLQAKA